MFIQTEQTPNPQTLKFIPGMQVMQSGTADFPSAETALKSPLAAELFNIEGVEGVFMGSDFITVTKAESKVWEVMKPEILHTIMDFFVTGKTIMGNETSNGGINFAELNEIEQQIAEIIENRVRPAVAMDGGDIIFRSFENGVVKVQLQGSCSGCPSSTATLKQGIENMLKHYVPEVESVEAVS